MRVCDYIADSLYYYGVRNVYGLMGGGAAGLNDGFIKQKNLNYICFHHEQGAGHAAIGEAKLTNRLAVVNPTTGCGGTNCMTSVLNAWQDSVPVLFISGNVRLNQTSTWLNKTRGVNVRKYGLQEHDIITSVKNMTKFAARIESPDCVVAVLEKAIAEATSKRKGPVWIDIPANVQTAEMPKTVTSFWEDGYNPPNPDDKLVRKMFDMVIRSTRPLILVGGGVWQSKTNIQFREFIERIQIPFVSTFASRDLIESSHPLNIGNIGVKGSRAGNFALQNCDLLLVLGCSLNNSHVGYDEKLFAPNAKKIVVDIDHAELSKGTVPMDMGIYMDLIDFFELAEQDPIDFSAVNDYWLKTCLHWKTKWPVYQPEYADDSDGINLYEIIKTFDGFMKDTDIIMTDAGSTSYVCPVALDFKKNQRMILSPSQGDMGWAVPASIGVALNTNKNIVVLVGDGSFYSNVQELAVAKYHNLNIKYVVVNNGGYLSIKNTQTKYYQGRVYGVDEKTGLFFPPLSKVADAFGLGYSLITNNQEMRSNLESLVHSTGSMIIEIRAKEMQEILPTISLLPDGKQGGLHQLYPFLSEEEYQREMVVKL